MTEATRSPIDPDTSRRLREPSALALRLGYAGLLPFIGGALLMWIVRPDVHPFVALALTAYGAVIVSFLGGLHWGLAMRQVQPDAALIAWGVVPSLVAWVAALMPPDAGLVVLGVMLIVCYQRDRKVFVREGAAGWLTLRFRLTAVASLSCFLGAAGA